MFSYVAAGSDKSVAPQLTKPKSTHLPLSCVRPILSPQDSPHNLSHKSTPSPQQLQAAPPPSSPEPGSVTPVGGPPNYPPPALPPGVAPPAQPPGGRTYIVPVQLASSKPPPVPQRSMSLSSAQPPPTPPRPK